MNEVTRIHLAKTSYDIEVPAKKDLQKYITSLEAYTSDVDVLTDIEIRMTELLAERGVMAGGVIGSDDVAAIKAQLGEPHEFSEDGEPVAPKSEAGVVSRRLYRDTDNSILGGVLSGISAYFGMNPVWIRLVSIVLLFVSFGVPIFVYLVLWVAIPPVRTAADRLRLTGKPVTVGSIQELNDVEFGARKNRVAPAVQRGLAIFMGTLSAIGAVITLAGVVMLTIAMFTEGYNWFTDSFVASGWLLYSIVAIGLTLLAALFTLISYSFFARTATKKIVVTGVAIILLGVSSVATAVGIVGFGSWTHSNEIERLTKTSRSSLPASFSGVKSVIVEEPSTGTGSKNNTHHYTASVEVSYVVSSDAPRYELVALEGVRPKVSIDGEVATISMIIPENTKNMYSRPSMTIYGPALTEARLKADGPWRLSYLTDSQDSLKVDASYGSSVELQQGRIGELSTYGSGSIDATGASVAVLRVDVLDRGSVEAGTVRSLSIRVPDVCPSSGSGAAKAQVEIEDVTEGTMEYNGQVQNVTSKETGCAVLEIGSEEIYENDIY